MKKCNSSRVIPFNHRLYHHHKNIISNVPTRLKEDPSTKATTTAIPTPPTNREECTVRTRGTKCRINQNSNHSKTFRLTNFSLIIQNSILILTLSLAVHLTSGSHLPTSYLVQRANSNDDNGYKIIISNANSEENLHDSSILSTTASPVSSDNEADSLSPTTAQAAESTADSEESSKNPTTTFVPLDTEPRPLEPGGVVNLLLTSSLTDAASSTTIAALEEVHDETVSTTDTHTTTELPSNSSTPTSSSVASSYEDSNDSNLNYISEHDHYDEYAILKAALEKERSPDIEVEEVTETAEPKVNAERRPYYLQAADGRKYASIEALCDDSKMTISGHFEDVFKGRIYALGYSDEKECGASNGKDPTQNITFSLQLGSCGVQMLAVDDNLENDLRHEVTLYIQYSAFLQQIVDEKISVSCTEMKRSSNEGALASNEDQFPSSRKGRRMGNIGDAGKYGSSTKISSRIGESWMEILAGKDPSPKSRKLSPVSVGEDVTLVISTKVLRGYDARIVNCSAHDGSRTGTIDGSRAQQILDSAGCSLDRSLVPNLRRRRLPIESRNRMITLHFATFPAFKFPERDHLHIKCAVAYCQGPCPQEPCDSVINHFGSWKDKYGRIADVLLDSTEVVNSVEVVAPEIDDLARGRSYERQSSVSSGSYSSLSSNGSQKPPALPSEISARQFPSDQHPTSSYSSYSSGSPSAAPSAAASAIPSMYGNSQGSLHQMNPDLHGSIGSSVCVSPGTVILALVILGVVLVISATATLWFALKRSEAKKYRHLKHSPFQHAPQPYYRFSHW